MRIFLFFFLLLATAGSAYTQEQPDQLAVADKHFAKYEYAYAAPLYERMASRRNPKAGILYKLAFCYDEMQQYEPALKWYNLYVQKDSAKNSAALLRIADIEKILQRYTEAKTSYRAYLNKMPGETARIQKRIDGCDSALQWTSQSSKTELHNEAQLNTALSDWGATYYGKQVVFTSEDSKKEVLDKKSKASAKEYGWMGNPYLRLYTSLEGWKDSVGGNAASFADFGARINGRRYHVGPANFSKNFDTVYFTVTHDRNELETKKYGKRSKLEKANLEIYSSIKDSAGNWGGAQRFAYNNAARYSVGHAALNREGSILYFTSDMPGGMGKTDIWFCKKEENGGWSAPVNCGASINTEEEEAFPTIGENDELYFSSKGLTGMGGLDIFVAAGSENNWSSPVNLKPPFNSGYDDFYFSVGRNREGYLSSNRQGGKGSDDIYSFASYTSPAAPKVKSADPVSKNPVLITITRSAADSSILKNSTATLTNLERKADWVKRSDENGRAGFIIEKEQTYRIHAESPGFVSDSIRFNTRQITADTITRPIYLKPKETIAAKPSEAIPYKVGDRFVLEDLHYDYDKYNIRPDADVILDRLIATLKKYPALEIELSSHTDSRGSDAYNELLSQRRAEAAVAYLVSKGINRSRLTAKGYGETRLLNRCSNGVSCSVEEHQQNRRTEVRVLKIR